jgi:peptidoglycan/xylan/chitin deacetylase (PgdA/CDA1 family)
MKVLALLFGVVVFLSALVGIVLFRPLPLDARGDVVVSAPVENLIAARADADQAPSVIAPDAPGIEDEGALLPPAIEASASYTAPITNGSRARPLVALTFDACEINAAGYDLGVINALTRAHAPATLFLGGKWMLDHPAATLALSKIPYFELANHSFSHPHFRALSDAQARAQITMTQEIMFKLTGTRGHLFRFPYGEYTAPDVALVQALGLEAIQWDVVSDDPEPRITAPIMIQRVLSRARDGSIIIMHMNGRGWHTAEALPTIIQQLRARGFALVTVSELLNASEAAARGNLTH